jgi:hypothetical protein
MTEMLSKKRGGFWDWIVAYVMWDWLLVFGRIRKGMPGEKREQMSEVCDGGRSGRGAPRRNEIRK